jgi:hypothetical protein
MPSRKRHPLSSILCILRFHVTDDGLPAIIHMDIATLILPAGYCRSSSLSLT